MNGHGLKRYSFHGHDPTRMGQRIAIIRGVPRVKMKKKKKKNHHAYGKRAHICKKRHYASCILGKIDFLPRSHLSFQEMNPSLPFHLLHSPVLNRSLGEREPNQSHLSLFLPPSRTKRRDGDREIRSAVTARRRTIKVDGEGVKIRVRGL